MKTKKKENKKKKKRTLQVHACRGLFGEVGFVFEERIETQPSGWRLGFKRSSGSFFQASLSLKSLEKELLNEGVKLTRQGGAAFLKSTLREALYFSRFREGTLYSGYSLKPSEVAQLIGPLFRALYQKRGTRRTTHNGGSCAQNLVGWLPSNRMETVYALAPLVISAHAREGRLAGGGSRLEEEWPRVDVRSNVYDCMHSHPYSFKHFGGIILRCYPSWLCVKVLILNAWLMQSSCTYFELISEFLMLWPSKCGHRGACEAVAVRPIRTVHSENLINDVIEKITETLKDHPKIMKVNGPSGIHALPTREVFLQFLLEACTLASLIDNTSFDAKANNVILGNGGSSPLVRLLVHWPPDSEFESPHMAFVSLIYIQANLIIGLHHLPP
ncbi:hypothetical protein VNO77_44212 [Canavalia gladiata]|uniref:Uncharacterized protein n=1 Tax=Canavalia gladiata TaxID=3824 RepID=A0AAN9JVI4_CANGL